MAHIAELFTLSYQPSVVCGVPAGGSYSLQVAHAETEAQTGAVTAQGCPALESLVLDLLGSMSSVPSPSPKADWISECTPSI